jgi:hypothetical protein
MGYRVLHCLAWVETWSRGQPRVERAGEQIDHGLAVADRSVAARLGLGDLHQAVDALDQIAGDLADEPAQNSVSVVLDGARRIDRRLGQELPATRLVGYAIDAEQFVRGVGINSAPFPCRTDRSAG